jgi:hypothetical protein
LAGLPPKIVLSGINELGGTTVLAAIILFSPITDPSQITVLLPITTPFLILLDIIVHPD